MSKKKYKSLLTVSGVFLILGYLFPEIATNFNNKSDFFVNYVTLYLFPIACLFLFYLGIYAKIKKVKTTSKSNSPLVIIIVSTILVFISFGQPIIQYLKLKNLAVKIYSDDELKNIKNDAVDLTISSKKRLNAAMVYYLESGESIEYYDKRGRLKKFSPDNRMKRELEKSEKMLEEIESMKNINQKRMKVYLGIFTFFGISFLVLLTATKR